MDGKANKQKKNKTATATKLFEKYNDNNNVIENIMTITMGI